MTREGAVGLRAASEGTRTAHGSRTCEVKVTGDHGRDDVGVGGHDRLQLLEESELGVLGGCGGPHNSDGRGCGGSEGRACWNNGEKLKRSTWR